MSVLSFTKDLYFTTSTVIDWIDLFTRPIYKRIVVDSLRYCQENKGLELYAWVLMSNHIHFIAGINGDNSISDILRDFKKYTSKQLVKAIQENQQESRKEWLIDRLSFRAANDRRITNFKLWQDGSYIETISTYNFYEQKLNYIHMNPVRQEITEQPEEYLYSSARDYIGQKGLLDVIVMS